MILILVRKDNNNDNNKYNSLTKIQTQTTAFYHPYSDDTRISVDISSTKDT